MVGTDPLEVDRLLLEGLLACPGCEQVLRPWGWARSRSVRELAEVVIVRPRRSLCSGCSCTHVLLPELLLLRRADTAAVIGTALTAKATGRGHRWIAALLDRPVSTVRAWLRRRRQDQLLRGCPVQLKAQQRQWHAVAQQVHGGVGDRRRELRGQHDEPETQRQRLIRDRRSLISQTGCGLLRCRLRAQVVGEPLVKVIEAEAAHPSAVVQDLVQDAPGGPATLGLGNHQAPLTVSGQHVEPVVVALTRARRPPVELLGDDQQVIAEYFRVDQNPRLQVTPLTQPSPR